MNKIITLIYLCVFLYDCFNYKLFNKELDSRLIEFEKGRFACYYHVVFMSSVVFILDGKDSFSLSLIHFPLDMLYLYRIDKLSTFSKYHHIFAIGILLSYLLFDMPTYFVGENIKVIEISTLILVLKNIKFISEKSFNYFFPSSFIIGRLFLYNIMNIQRIKEKIIYLSMEKRVLYLNYYFLINLMNICISIKMRLFNKIMDNFTPFYISKKNLE